MSFETILPVCLLGLIVGLTTLGRRRGWGWGRTLASQSLLFGLTAMSGAPLLLPPDLAHVVGLGAMAIALPASVLYGLLINRRLGRTSGRLQMLSAHDPSTGNERTAALLLQLADEVDAEETVRARRRKLRLWLLPAAGLGAAATLLGSWTLGLGALGAALYGWLRVARSGKPGDEGAGLDPGSDPRRAGSILPGGGTPPR